MKKGIIIEIKNKQKVVLADNGRFYVCSLKKGEAVGSRVKVGMPYRYIALLSACAAFCMTAFVAGMITMRAINSSVPDTLVQLRTVSTDGQSFAIMELIVNSEGTVLSTAPVDEAAEIIMAGESFKGKSLEDAAKIYLVLSAQCGFVNIAEGSFVAANSYNHSKRSADGMLSRITATVNGYASEHNLRVSSLKARHKLPADIAVNECTENYVVPVYIAALIQHRADDELLTLPACIDRLKTLPNHKVMGIIRSAHIKYAQNYDSQKKSHLMEKKQELKQNYQQRLDLNSTYPAGRHEEWNNSAKDNVFVWTFEPNVPLYLIAGGSEEE